MGDILTAAFADLTKEQQTEYLKQHPNSKFASGTKSKSVGYDGLLDIAQKQADKAKDGTANIDGETYTFKFNRNEWNYDIYNSSGEREITIKGKSLPQVKKDFTEWLRS